MEQNHVNTAKMCANKVITLLIELSKLQWARNNSRNKLFRNCARTSCTIEYESLSDGLWTVGQQLVAQINLMMVSCVINTSWGTFELESATGKSQAIVG